MRFLTQKRFVVVGLATERSIAAGVAAALHRAGAELILVYQGEKLRSRVEKMAELWNATAIYPCDVAQDAEIQQLFTQIATHWDGLDGLIHSVAYAPAEQLDGDYLTVLNRTGFQIAHDISAYSLGALTQAALPLLTARKGSVLTLTYLGSERTFPNYNVMGLAKASLEANVRYLAGSAGPRGIRVNGISAGPIRTLAASGIHGLRTMLDHHAKSAPLQRNTSIEEVGNAAAFLCSDYASGITGEILHVDCGYHCVGMPGL